MSTQLMTEKIAEYFKTQPVLKAWLFGSFARGEETPESDVDILFHRMKIRLTEWKIRQSFCFVGFVKKSCRKTCMGFCAF
ncbi:MAG: nucleotidyltransferase domain-containing protein [Prevotella sp.]|nr:nucleotidyltransferase domain-containing protein [Prevotella sp.]